jgi:Tn3 transposase DDE domain
VNILLTSVSALTVQFVDQPFDQ